MLYNVKHKKVGISTQPLIAFLTTQANSGFRQNEIGQVSILNQANFKLPISD